MKTMYKQQEDIKRTEIVKRKSRIKEYNNRTEKLTREMHRQTGSEEETIRKLEDRSSEIIKSEKQRNKKVQKAC